MLLGFLSFLRLSFVDILDILMVGVIIYVIFRWIKGSSAVNIFFAIILLFLVRIIALALNMKMMSAIMGTVVDVGVIALIVLFQPEIRQFLNRMGSRAGIAKDGRTLIDKLLGRKEASMDAAITDEITKACSEMSEQLTGALIVIPHRDTLESIISTGDRIDAMVSKRLIENIFFKNSPLHDGAMILSGDRIIAARCTLPITDRSDIPASYGMRHKAAIGISERSDADVIVVSEQTGAISFVRGGKPEKITNINTLKLLLSRGNDSEENNNQAQG